MTAVLAVACDPATAYVQYAGAGSKLYRTRDAWQDTPEMVKDAGATITAIYISPVYNHLLFPDNARIVFGTQAGTVFRSVDGGTHWTQCTALPVSGSVAHVVTDPTNDLRIDVAIGSSHCRSSDGGLHWAVVHTFADQTINDMAWQRLGYSTFYAALNSAVPISRSGDDGLTYLDEEGLDDLTDVASVSASPFNTQNGLALVADTAAVYARSSASPIWGYAGDVVGFGQRVRYDPMMYGIAFAGTTEELDKTMDEGLVWGWVKQEINVHDISLGPMDRVPVPFKVVVLLSNGMVAKYNGELGTWSSASCPTGTGGVNSGPRLVITDSEKAMFVIDNTNESIWGAPYPAMGPWTEVLPVFAQGSGACRRIYKNGDQCEFEGMWGGFLSSPEDPRYYQNGFINDDLSIASNVNEVFYITDPLPDHKNGDDGIRYPAGLYDVYRHNFICIYMDCYRGWYEPDHPTPPYMHQGYKYFVGMTSPAYPPKVYSYNPISVGPWSYWGYHDPDTNTTEPVQFRGPGVIHGEVAGGATPDHGTVLGGSEEWLCCPENWKDRQDWYGYNIQQVEFLGDFVLWRYSKKTNTWTDITANLPIGFGSSPQHNAAITIDANDYVYFGCYDGTDNYGPRVWGSRNNGVTWQELPGLHNVAEGRGIRAIRGVSEV